MSANPRCHECGHKRGPRVLAYRKTEGGKRPDAEKRQHKNSCTCSCHFKGKAV